MQNIDLLAQFLCFLNLFFPSWVIYYLIYDPMTRKNPNKHQNMKIFGMQSHLAVIPTLVLRPSNHFIFVVLVRFDTYNALAIINTAYSAQTQQKQQIIA